MEEGDAHVFPQALVKANGHVGRGVSLFKSVFLLGGGGKDDKAAYVVGLLDRWLSNRKTRYFYMYNKKPILV